MSDENTPFIVVPFNPIPAEKDPNATPASIQKQKTFIRTHIIGKTNAELVKDKDAMILLNKLGSDLNINAFACNFRYSDGRVNDDILEANWLNRRIFERLSVTDPDEDPLSIPFYLTSTVFAEKDYGECADEFKRRLGLKGKQDLFVLRNVVMSPFATTNDFVAELAGVFQQVLEEEIEASCLYLVLSWPSLTCMCSECSTPKRARSREAHLHRSRHRQTAFCTYAIVPHGERSASAHLHGRRPSR